MINRPSISMAIPAFNEEQYLLPTVETVLEAISQTHWSDFEIIIVNDGSSDKTLEVANKIQGQKVKVISHQTPQGLGAAIKSALAIASNDYFIEVHGKNDITSTELKKILSARDKADLIIPFQLNKNERSPFRRLLSNIFVMLLNLFAGHKIRYYNHYLLTKREHLKNIQIETTSYAFQAEIIIHLLRKKLSYHEVGVIDTFRTTSKSKAFRLPNIWGVSRFLLRVALKRV